MYPFKNVTLFVWPWCRDFDADFIICFFSQELENLRKQAEIIPQLMSECESVTEKLQVDLKQPEIRQTPQLFYFERYKSHKDLELTCTRVDVMSAAGRQNTGPVQCSQMDIKNHSSIHK